MARRTKPRRAKNLTSRATSAVVQKRAGVGSAESIISGLPKRTMLETSGIWQNAVAALATANKRHLHDDARQVISGIRREWARRSTLPFDPTGYFRWPSTEAPVGVGDIMADDWLQVGMLAFLGYRVGKRDGKATPERQIILDEVFNSNLPPAFPPYYVSQWGKPSSATRLRKTAEAIAAFARNAKRRDDERLDQAIADWQADLDFLYRKYYVGKFQFSFPTTHLV